MKIIRGYKVYFSYSEFPMYYTGSSMTVTDESLWRKDVLGHLLLLCFGGFKWINGIWITRRGHTSQWTERVVGEDSSSNDLYVSTIDSNVKVHELLLTFSLTFTGEVNLPRYSVPCGVQELRISTLSETTSRVGWRVKFLLYLLRFINIRWTGPMWQPVTVDGPKSGVSRTESWDIRE